MNNFSYENQGTNTYLVYEIGSEDTVDSMSIGMLTNNKIPGLAQTLFTQMDNKRFIKFNISSRISVSQFFSGAVNKKRLLGVFTGIVDAMLSAEDYMIDFNSILLNLDYIYADVTTCETVLICLPLANSTNSNQELGAFFKNIMFSTQFDQTENCDHVAKIINYLNATPQLSLVDFKALLEGIKTSGSQPVVTNIRPENRPVDMYAATQKQQAVPMNPGVNMGFQPGSGPASPVPGVPQGAPVPGPAPHTPPKKGSSEPQVKTTGEKEISFFYLMQHYNKENAAAYKAQKEAKKQAGANKKPSKKSKNSKNSNVASQPSTGNFGFVVPGQPASPVPPAQGMGAPVPQGAAPQKPVPPMSVPPMPAPQMAVPPMPQQPAANMPQQQPAYVPRQMPQVQPMNFGETTVLNSGAIGETTVLNVAQNAAPTITPHLVRKKNNEIIYLNKPVFRIGKEKSFVDYFIGDNTAISRSHANFINRGGQCFVVDTNSTNRTFVNETMIQSNEEIQISHGDMIRLANEEFEFKLY